jgi:hypothetical protein
MDSQPALATATKAKIKVTIEPTLETILSCHSTDIHAEAIASDQALTSGVDDGKPYGLRRATKYYTESTNAQIMTEEGNVQAFHMNHAKLRVS